MKKILGFLAILTLIFVGCGKKSENVDQKTTKIASNIDQFKKTGESEYIIVDENAPDLEEFAFVEEDFEDSKDNYLAEAGIDLINEEKLEDVDLESDKYVAVDEKEEKFENIQYAFNARSPLKSQQEVIQQNIETAKKVVAEGDSISVNGYCCEIGDAKFNMGLSVKRANAIKQEMLKNGVPEEKIVVVGCGQECPLVESTVEDREARKNELSPNRRVEIYALNS